MIPSDLETEVHELRARLRDREMKVERLTQELAETNRGVVALYAELDDRALTLGQLSESKTRFLSDISHELRAPLASVINLTRLLLAHADGPLTAEQEYQVALIQRSAESLAEMVNDLLDIAKIEARRIELRLEPVSVSEIFAGLRGLFRPLATNERVEFLVEDPPEPIVLVTDAQRVAQVDGPIQKRVRGTGLGLPLTRKLAPLLGGEVRLESRVGEGSRFSLVVPRVHPSGQGA